MLEPKTMDPTASAFVPKMISTKTGSNDKSMLKMEVIDFRVMVGDGTHHISLEEYFVVVGPIIPKEKRIIATDTTAADNTFAAINCVIRRVMVPMHIATSIVGANGAVYYVEIALGDRAISGSDNQWMRASIRVNNSPTIIRAFDARYRYKISIQVNSIKNLLDL